MQRKDIILEWIFLSHKQSKKLQTYIEKISDLNLEGKLRFHQLTEMEPAKVIVPLMRNILICEKIINIGKEFTVIWEERLTTVIPKVRKLNS